MFAIHPFAAACEIKTPTRAAPLLCAGPFRHSNIALGAYGKLLSSRGVTPRAPTSVLGNNAHREGRIMSVDLFIFLFFHFQAHIK
jgi:hypothetical protein